MAAFGQRVLVIFIISQVVGNAVCQQPNLASFGDFMEFFLSMNKACADVRDAQNITQGLIQMFTECTIRLKDAPPKDEFENMAVICKNREKYFSCWDNFKSGTLKSCGSDKEQYLPILYKATVASMCGNDNAAKIIASLKQALSELTEQDQNNCPEETGQHWLERCQSILVLMNSPDACTRHKAIENCLKKITCQNIKMARLFQDIYSGGRTSLNCSN